jgi:uncharacterized membrane protein YjdF
MLLKFLNEKKNYLVLALTLVYLAAFTVIALVQVNYEFLYYTFLLVSLIFLVLVVNRSLDLAFFIIFNLSLIGFLHLLGGNYYVEDVRLYDFWIINGWFKYDNFVHLYATFIGTLALYTLLDRLVGPQVRKNDFLFLGILILMAMGMGTMVELSELGAVLYFDASEQVGDYLNNAFDLFFNTIGALLAVVVLYFYRRQPMFIKRLNERQK